ncbi:MAG: NFACT RNA binding domain-containing protein [bacterium]
MLNNYYTIKAVAEHLNEMLKGYSIAEAYTQVKDKLYIEAVRHEEEKIVAVEFSVEKDLNYAVIKNNFSKARKNYANLFEEITGRMILSVELLDQDRIIKAVLENNLEIVFTFFAGKSNCFILENSIVINAFKNRSELSGKNISEIIPAGNPDNKNNSAVNIAEYLKLNHRKFGALYWKETLFRAGLKPDDLTSESNIQKLLPELKNIEASLNDPKFLLYINEQEAQMSLILLKHLSDEYSSFENINELINRYLRFNYTINKTVGLKDRKLKELSVKLAGVEKKISGLKIQLKHSEDSDEIRKQGDFILQNLHVITKGSKTILYENEDTQKELKLKENLTPVENAQLYFEKYKKQKASVNILKSKVAGIEKEKNNILNEIETVKKMEEYKTLEKQEKQSTEEKKDETSKFRKFRLNESYEVWVGRDSRSNDELTTRHTSPNDLWFHVRGASGSHTVLKTGNRKDSVDKVVINKAAAIAAYYSKARNSSNVPVAYCEKKYVKKKKGFKEGSVVMEREKVIFVRPSLPEVSHA